MDVRADRLVVIAEGVRRARAGGGRQRAGCRTHGIRRPYFVFVGALDARKDPLSRLRTWEVAKRAGAEVELVLAGTASRQAPTDMGGAPQLGYLDQSSLVDLYSAVTSLLFPSRYEGFGLPILEAMACGCQASDLPQLESARGGWRRRCDRR